MATPDSSPQTTFLKFDQFPWTQDRDFIQGLHATLGTSLSSSNDPFTRCKLLDTILQTRIWWYQSRTNILIDLNSYLTFTASNPRTNPDQQILKKTEWIYTQLQARLNLQQQQPGSESEVDIPAWQLQAPQMDLSKKADDNEAREVGGEAGEGGAPYPDKFQAIIEAVTTGKTIEGIKEIPNTVVRQEGITPVGVKVAPPKPWQRHLPPKGGRAHDERSQLGDVLDTQFPPIA
ncbi:hypothetical protein QBC38DRAFT_155899 [Podospora fimiseda]|uniref:Uncharacterized protein n=1 Tax=Podospora fimiseda TaxID=252190 RepID=A0AAN7BRY9_9PEZI|nr:hypothetical protein QBC38DRAFT_155899 [Podospora fimiseda]